MANIQKMAREGFPVAAGPFDDKSSIFRAHNQGKLGAAGDFETAGGPLSLTIFKPISPDDAHHVLPW
jgi:hypothetical protein